MLNKEKLLSHINKPEDKVFLTKLLDKVEKVLRDYEPGKTDFFDPYQGLLAESILKGIEDLNYRFAGGYPEAERQRILIFPEYFDEEDVEDDIEVLKVTGNFKFHRVTHRDFMGAILALGLKREKLGDILVVESGCQLFVDKELADYISLNLDQIHRVSVKVQRVNPLEVFIPLEKVKVIETTVASLRLDVIAAAGFGGSRSQMTREFAGDKFKLNWGVKASPDYQVKAGDVISLRGKGRIKVVDIKGVTTKGRFKISIKRYI